ncbi:MAG: hypothetical protein ACLS9T_08090 [Streptococcus salivarius]
MKKSIFKASFEESLNLLDDAFTSVYKERLLRKTGQRLKQWKAKYWF